MYESELVSASLLTLFQVDSILLHMAQTSNRPIAQNGFALRDFRVCRGLSVDELANRIQISGPHLRNLELEHRSATDVDLNKLAYALDINVASLRRTSVADRAQATA